MGKKNSKLKGEVVARLAKETYCEYTSPSCIRKRCCMADTSRPRRSARERLPKAFPRANRRGIYRHQSAVVSGRTYSHYGHTQRRNAVAGPIVF
ncbi:hypothetical protein MRX96_013775 [Rhipicephalus microplus]